MRRILQPDTTDLKVGPTLPMLAHCQDSHIAKVSLETTSRLVRRVLIAKPSFLNGPEDVIVGAGGRIGFIVPARSVDAAVVEGIFR